MEGRNGNRFNEHDCATGKNVSAVKDTVATLSAHAKARKDSAIHQKISDACMDYRRIAVQVKQFADDSKQGTPVFPDETLFKQTRDALRHNITLIIKLDKIAKAEKAAGKEEEDEDTDAVAPAEAEEQEEATSNVIAVECYSKARNSKARNELIGTDAKLAQAMKMVARGEKGRSGPKVDGAKQFKHIHIGGGGTDNLLFQANSDGGVVLGRIDFHMQNALNKAEKKRIKDVAGRSGTTVTLTIDGNRIS